MSKELLTEILEAVQDFQSYLTSDLQREHLSPDGENRRQQLAQTASDIIAKIRSTHVSIRPRLVTPSSAGKSPNIGKKPPPKPPAPPPVGEAEAEGEQEMYIECDPQTAEPEDYLQFTSQNSEEPQEMYEAMNPEDEPQDLYEEPVQGSLSPSLQGAARASQSSSQEDRQQEMYEEPVVFPQGHTPTPPASAENSGSGAVYMRAGVNVVPNTLSPETATEWMYDVSAPKADKMKVSQLQNVLCKGNLEKLGGKSKKTWQIRYCVLSGLFMYFYEKESSKTYRNRISLPQYTPELAPEHTNPKKRHYAFKLTHTDDSGKQKDYFFRSTKKESRDTWLKTIGEATQRTFPSMTSTSSKTSMTMPRMPSSKSSLSPETKARASSLGPEDVQQETYEPIEPINEMTASDEENLEEYVDVNPEQLQQDEYVAVEPSQLEDGDIQEEYETPDQFQSTFSPPPPITPPPPPTTPPPPSHRPDPPIDLNKIYKCTPNGIDLRKVYVALWDFTAAENDELSVRRGDLVHVIDPDPMAEWWAGEGLNVGASAKTGMYGFLPASHMMAAFEEVAS